MKAIYGAFSDLKSVVAGNDGSFEFQVDMPLIGNYTVTVEVLDEAGNSASSLLFFERERETTPDNGPSDGSDWLEDNWVYLILVASIIASIAILMITFYPRKRYARPAPRAPERVHRKGEHEEAEEPDREKDFDGEYEDDEVLAEGFEEGEYPEEEDWEEPEEAEEP
jgi:hypothetical protein